MIPDDIYANLVDMLVIWETGGSVEASSKFHTNLKQLLIQNKDITEEKLAELVAEERQYQS